MHVRIARRRGRGRAGCASTSRRASSRRSCAAARFTEAPDITARICGICPVAYQMSACAAMEDACGVDGRRADPRACAGSSTAASGSRATRCTSTCSTRPTSSATTSAFEMARDHRDDRRAGAADEEGRQRAHARSSAAGRSIRSTSASAASTARRRARELRAAASSRSSARARSRSRRSRWTAGAAVPRLRAATTSSSRCATPGEYPIDARAARLEPRARHRAGRVRRARRRGARRALDRAARAAARAAARYLVGPLARFALNSRPRSRRWPARRRDAAGLGAGLPQPVPEHRRPRGRDPLRAATRRCGSSTPTSRPTRRRSRSPPRAGVGYGWTEAPRGLLYHRYELDADGTILDARIVPPTSQNQARDRAGPARVRRAPPRPRRRRAAAAAASRRSATTTRASPARRTS